MLQTLVITELTDRYFTDAALLWQLSGVGNPARGDDFAAVANTLAHGGRLVILYDMVAAPFTGAYPDTNVPVKGTATKDLPLGTVWLSHDYRRMYIHHMAVHPEHQNKGYGRLLMDEAMKYAHELGLQAKLEVKSTNIPANQLYSHYGFEVLEGYLLMIKRKV